MALRQAEKSLQNHENLIRIGCILTNTLGGCVVTKAGEDKKSKTKMDQTETTPGQIDSETLAKLSNLRAQVRENFGKIAMAMMALPRYRHHTIADLQSLVLEPLMRDKIALAYPKNTDQPLLDVTGMAIWASVSEEVDAKIREQIKAGVFPVRLKAEEWTSGEINWLFDVIASDEKTTGAVIANFRRVAGEGELRVHPIIGRLVDKDMLERMTTKPGQAPGAEQAPEPASSTAH